jgi:hypothetical protein
MERPIGKQFWFWAVIVLVLAALLSSPVVRIEYHKWRLESTKARKVQLMGATLSVLDKFWLHVAGSPVSGEELDQAIRKHEAALVKLGFLRQQTLPMELVSSCREIKESLAGLRGECPWYDLQTVAGTNLLVTACPKMMELWRKRGQELGW